MSWFGGGLSSLTGQLSNLTKDILTEGTDEVSGMILNGNLWSTDSSAGSEHVIVAANL